ncbi:putative ABC transport system permease protein [Pedobacter sp. UYEF25]
MVKNYIKTSFRYLKKYRVFSVINLIGLSLGLCICFFAFLYVSFEMNHDTAPKQASQIYSLVTDEKKPDGINYESASAAMGPAMLVEFPEVKAFVRIFLDDYIIQKGQENYGTAPLAYADSTLFSIFSFPLIAGNTKTLFNAPFDMVLSESAAKKYFGTTNCLGKTLTLNGNQHATVTGVMKDIPANSHFKRDIILSLSSLIGIEGNSTWTTNWNRYGFNTYLLLKKNASIEKLTAKLPDFIKRHNVQTNMIQILALEPLKDVYLKGKARGSKAGTMDHGDIIHVYAFSLIAILVLFIACFNFINLTTAFSLQRTKEIGIRKVLGAVKQQLIIQFMSDALIICLIAFGVALLLAILLMPTFNQMIDVKLGFSFNQELKAIALLFLSSILVGLISGLYPALFLSSFKSINSLKGIENLKGYSVRKTLVIVQFCIAIGLIISTLLIYRQIDFMKNQDLGFKKDHMVVIDFQYDNRILNHRDAIKTQLAEIAGVKETSFSSYIPGKPNRKFPVEIESANRVKKEFQSDAYFVDEDFLKQYQIEILAGRNFSNTFNDKSQSMILNEAALKTLGYKNPQDAIGKRFSQKTANGDGTIVGVIKNFHFHSMEQEIPPLTLRVSPGFFTFLSVTISGKDVPNTLRSIAHKWAEFAPDLPFSYFFSDDAYNAIYKSDDDFQKVFTYLSIIAILISSLGIFGLSVFSMAQRKKEIGIRKVLGASIPEIIKVLSLDFIKLVVVAFFLAIPLAWFGVYYWLQEFAYRAEIVWWIFPVSGLVAMCIAFLTISFQAMKAALANPIKSLRTE